MPSGSSADVLALPESAGFEVERFDWGSDGRLEVEGRWSRVRGLRFMRPVLTVSVPQGRRRVIALLEHKPWEPSEGGRWIAAFPWDGDREAVGSAQLAVATGLVVDLPAPGPDAARRAPTPPSVTPAVVALRRAEQAEARVVRESEAAQALIRREREEHEHLRHELDGARQQLERTLAGERVVHEAVRLQLAATRAQLEEARADGRLLGDELRDERNTARTDREAAQVRQHELAQERTTLLEERDRAISARDAALELAQRVDVTEERDRLARELEEAKERLRALERRADRAALAERAAAERARATEARTGQSSPPSAPRAAAATRRRVDTSFAPGESVRRIPRAPAAPDPAPDVPADDAASAPAPAPAAPPLTVPAGADPEPSAPGEGAKEAEERLSARRPEPAAPNLPQRSRARRQVPDLIDDLATAGPLTGGDADVDKPLLSRADPLGRSPAAAWGGRVAALALLLAVIVVLAIVLL